MPRLNKRKSSIASTGVFFLFAMLLSVGVAVLSYCSVRTFEARAVWVQHTHTVLQRLEETHSTLRDLVANARGYALSGRHEYLLSFETDRIALFGMLDLLRALQIDNQAQLDRLFHLSDSIARRVELARTLLEVDKNAQIDSIYAHGRDMSEDIRLQFTKLKEVENTLLAARSIESQNSIHRSIFAIVGGSVVSLLMLIAVYLRLRREMLSRKEEQARTQRYAVELADLYNQAPCGYHSVDEDSDLIVQINDTALSWLGYTREQVIGKLRQSDLLTPESAGRYRLEVGPHFARDAAVTHVDLDYRRADGTHFPVRMSADSASQSGSLQRIRRHVSVDIAARKQCDREIEELNDNLKRHALHLGNINKELESFSYSVSHDLRAPLRAISGYAMMVEEDYADSLDDKGRELLQVIRKNVQKMDGLINDLLKLSKSTTGELIPSNFSMQETIEERINSLRREYPAVEFIVDPVADVVASHGLIAQVWEQLLGNAVKFSSKTAQPVVSVSANVTPEEVVYQVRDNGVGFDMRYVHKLFGTFQRLHRQEDFPGSGIGLALVQRIVVRHSGRVWAESVPGESTGFYFALPRIKR